MPLKLSLKPKEAVVVNGAVLRNGDRRGTILLQNQARVLRQKDVLQAEATESPVQHLYFAVMQMYLTGETDSGLYEDAMNVLTDVIATSQDDILTQRAVEVSILLAADRIYNALSKCRQMMKAAGGQNG